MALFWCLLLLDKAKTTERITYIHSHTHTDTHTNAHTHIPDPCALRLSGGLVKSRVCERGCAVCVCVSPLNPSLNREGTQTREKEADKSEDGNNVENG